MNRYETLVIYSFIPLFLMSELHVQQYLLCFVTKLTLPELNLRT